MQVGHRWPIRPRGGSNMCQVLDDFFGVFCFSCPRLATKISKVSITYTSGSTFWDKWSTSSKLWENKTSNNSKCTTAIFLILFLQNNWYSLPLIQHCSHLINAEIYHSATFYLHLMHFLCYSGKSSGSIWSFALNCHIWAGYIKQGKSYARTGNYQNLNTQPLTMFLNLHL